MEEELYRIGEAELVYYHLYEPEDGEYIGYFIVHTEDFLEMLIDDFIEGMMDQN